MEFICCFDNLDTSLFSFELFFVDSVGAICGRVFVFGFLFFFFFFNGSCWLYLVAIYTKNGDKLQNLSVGM